MQQIATGYRDRRFVVQIISYSYANGRVRDVIAGKRAGRAGPKISREEDARGG